MISTQEYITYDIMMKRADY